MENKSVFNCFLNCVMLLLSRMFLGSLIHRVGPAQANARRPKRSRLTLGTSSSNPPAKRSERGGVWRRSSAARYSGVPLYMALCTSTSSLLPISQYVTIFNGFRNNHSTSLVLTESVEKVISAIDKQESTIGVFIVLKKAFDTVEILLSKLQCYGIRSLALDWIKNYLASRSQYVCYNNSNSELKNIKC